MNETQFWILMALKRPISATKQKEIYAAIYEMQPIKDGNTGDITLAFERTQSL